MTSYVIALKLAGFTGIDFWEKNNGSGLPPQLSIVMLLKTFFCHEKWTKHIQKQKMKLKSRLVNVLLIKTSFFSAYLSLLRTGFLARHAKNSTKNKTKQKT